MIVIAIYTAKDCVYTIMFIQLFLQFIHFKSVALFFESTNKSLQDTILPKSPSCGHNFVQIISIGVLWATFIETYVIAVHNVFFCVTRGDSYRNFVFNSIEKMYESFFLILLLSSAHTSLSWSK